MRKELITYQTPKAPISEIFRTLRTNIQFMSTKGKLKTLLVTSTLPGEGKSWVSSNLAVTFAQAGKRVILVDADMRKGRQYSIFGISPRPGLSNYLSGIDSDMNKEDSEDLANYIQETDVNNLYVITAGNIPPNPSELLISEQMLNLLDDLKELCDIVIVDGPPSQLVADSLIVAGLVDSTVIVTASRQTRKDSLKRIIDSIKNVGGKIAGVVINKVPVSIKEYEKSYYYGSTSLENVNRKSNNAGASRSLANIGGSEKFRNMDVQKQKKEDETMNSRNNTKSNIKIEVEKPSKEYKTQNYNGNKEEISLEKTNDILKQINEYIDKEKKNLN